MAIVKIGDRAPTFTLPTDNKGSVALVKLKGKNVVIYFYPKDDTPGCTLEAKEFRDLMPEFEKLNTVIIGMSKDSTESHTKFKEKFCLPFILATDESGRVCEEYGVWTEKSMYGKKYMGIDRTTFLIDAEGKISHIWQKVRVEGHAKEVLEAVKGVETAKAS